MRSLGVSLINVSMGNPYASPHLMRPFEYPPPDGYDTPEHPLDRRRSTLPPRRPLCRPPTRIFPSSAAATATCRSSFRKRAQRTFARARSPSSASAGRRCSMPDLAPICQEHGTLDRKRVCRTFSYCTALMRAKHNELGQFATGCPPFDKEVYGPLWDLAKKKA